MRKRVTAVVIRDSKVLLVRDKGLASFSLPGGAIKNGESVKSAAARELYEELKLNSIKVTRLPGCDFKGSVNDHKVCLVQAEGEPQLRQELDKFIWWDIREPITIAVFAHVNNILKRFRSSQK
ncbi:hypothetical protein ES707_18229 [subsurface metagenome]